MFYCPNCNNIYDITKNLPNIPNMTGGQVSDTPETVSSITTDTDVINVLVNKILSNETVNKNDLKGVTIDSVTKSPSYKKLQAKSKELVHNKLNDLLNNENNEPKSSPASSNAFFICKNCGNHEPIKPNTLIARKLYGENNEIEFEDTNKFKEMAHVKCIPLTRHYICPNKNCQSHTDFSLRAARFYRVTGSFRVRYVCTACEQSWTS
ncbi:DNA-dependent RNA polymerase subunit Rpb9 [Catovirus CTV1]|uniref:DNA-dependent RNA polymerase subunit Rpb9 n=1 Tax=Catovirus CTV1 TaxID=1977631 RepID=A0A1V0SB44_9VIRU|nr:DNA-dependent RNA polymerase subunit Rpb9 [Catovirus CTV1]